MCGIVGYVGDRVADSVILVDLERLEYRGYDSAGIATISHNELHIRKKKGRLKVLNELLAESPIGGNIGIGHTRWATHGEPSDINSHPHTDCTKKIAVVHNGIIENYQELKKQLLEEGHIFESETDTEVIPHLIEKFYTTDIEEATRKALNLLKGSYAICVICENEPTKIISARCGSPLILGLGKNENFIASDIPAILPHTKNIIILDDNEMAIVTKELIKITDFKGNTIIKKPLFIEVEPSEVDKGDFETYMLKEIYEQPLILEKIINEYAKNSKIEFPTLSIDKKTLARTKRIIIQACGTSHHAGLIAKFWLEKFAHIHTEVDISSEYRYRNPIYEGDTIMIAISQSGETADTIAGVREAKSKFIKILSFVNVTTSTLARESDSIIPILAGPEIGVASTKAYTAQLSTLLLFSLYLGQLNYIVSNEQLKKYIDELIKIPNHLRKILSQQDDILEISQQYYKAKDFIFLGRGLNYPTALEGALKLKEIAYVHATGYPAGEFKHGPIAMVDENMPVVCINPKSGIYEKMFSNIEEVAARKGRIISIATQDDERIKSISRHVIYIPPCDEIVSPILAVLPLQLLAYHIAIKLSCDVDKPRNLAKSVTVE